MAKPITGYTSSGQAYYTDPNSRVTTYYQGDEGYRPAPAPAPRPAPVAAPAPASGGLLQQPVAAPKPYTAPAANPTGGLNAVTQSQWNSLQPTGAPGNTFAGNLFQQVMANNGLNPAVYSATHNDVGTLQVGGGYGQTPEEIRAYAEKIQPYYEVTAAPAAERTGANVSRGAIYDQLQKQAKDNGYTWQSMTGNYNAYDAAGLLSGQGISSLDQLGFGADGSLINKATGQPLTTREKDQLGMSAKGDGRVDYDIRKDANGNPMIVPKWKSSTTDLGVVGALAPIALSLAFPGFGSLGAAALQGGLTIAQGGELIDALKAAGLTYAGAELGAAAKDYALSYAADKGWSLPDFTGTEKFGDYDLGSSPLGTPSTGNGFFDSVGLGNSTGSGGGTGSGLTLNPNTWGNVNFPTTGIGSNTYNPVDTDLQSGTNPINNNGNGLSTAPKDPFVIGGSNSGLTAYPGTGTNLFQPTGSGGLLGTGGTTGTGGGLINTIRNIPVSPNAGTVARLLAGAAGGLAGGVEGGSGGGYKDDGYRPVIERGGWSPTATPTLGGPSGIGLISLKNKGQPNDGLWRYGLLGG